MKKLISSLCLCAVSILSFAQGPVEKIGAPAGHKEVLTIKIDIAGAQTVTADSLSITMIPFSGTVDCPNFKGEVLPTGVDTQVGKPTGRTLSARYMIKGKDIKGEDCTIFIENNGDMGEKYTRPFIVTDSKALSFLNNALLLGQLDFTSGGLTIRIYCPDELIK
ncbi:MAG: DUF3237 family protein [Bacteroidales bacterium]|nr:DUF3237 family protein [Bacteroidales bacterium]MBR5955328.1 DUF3237 family protein [Bacteroidales bacterium]